MDTPQYTPLDIETGSADDLYRITPGSGYIRLTGVGDLAEQGTRSVRPRTPYVTVNGHLFDFPALDRHAGIPAEQTIPFSRDLRVAAFQHDPPTSYQTKRGPGFKPYSMAALTSRYLGQDTKSDIGKALAREYGGWDRIPVDEPRYAEYLRSDLDNTRRLNEAIPWDPYEQREAWVATITARATLTGFRADTEALRARVALLDERSARGRQMLAESFGFPLLTKDGKSEAKAPQRTTAGKAAFEEALKSFGVDVSSWPRGKDGTLSLGREVMEKAATWAHETAHPSLPVIEAVQDMNGIRNSAANLLNHVTDGRVHYPFEPFQATGRWSCGLTVLKKSSEDSERAFLLPDEGHVLVSIDLDQIDIRAAAAHAQDPALIALLNDPGRDIHTEIATLSGVERKLAKTLDLGWLYGRTVNGLAQTPGMTREAAERVSSFMNDSYPGVRRWQREVRERGEAGLLLGNGWGRNLRVEAERAFTQAPGAVGQSTTRDIVAEGMLDLARRAPEMLPMLRCAVHDEVIFSVPEADKEECARIIQSCMTRMWAPAGCSMPVAITAGAGKPFSFGRNWAQLYG